MELIIEKTELTDRQKAIVYDLIANRDSIARALKKHDIPIRELVKAQWLRDALVELVGYDREFDRAWVLDKWFGMYEISDVLSRTDDARWMQMQAKCLENIQLILNLVSHDDVEQKKESVSDAARRVLSKKGVKRELVEIPEIPVVIEDKDANRES